MRDETQNDDGGGSNNIGWKFGGLVELNYYLHTDSKSFKGVWIQAKRL